MLTFNHFNFNVADLETSLRFYKDALGLEPVGERKEAADGSFVIVYLGDGKTDFRLELTWLRDHPQKYDLGECEFHLALRADDYEAAHKSMRKWAASALKILPWGFILSPIRMATGSRSFPPDKPSSGRRINRARGACVYTTVSPK